MKVLEKEEISRRLRAVLLWFSIVALLAGSVFVLIFVNRSVENQRMVEFLGVMEETEERVRDSVRSIVERLYDLRGFVSSESITHEKWNDYLVSIGVQERIPGVYTFAYSPLVKREDLEKYINQVRKENKEDIYKDYSVFPTTQTAEVIPIKYLLTSDPDLDSLLGYDIGTSDTQVEALKKAVAEDIPVITGLLHLGLVIPGSSKVGYVVMLPVYNKINIASFPKEERRQHLIGLVGTWTFPEGLIAPADKDEALETKGVSLSVYDGDSKIYSVGDGVGNLKQVKEVEILTKAFRFEFTGKRQVVLSPFTESLPWFTFAGLLLINLMWIATVTSILQSRRQAEKMALEATKDLRKFKQAVEGVSDLVVITDENGVISYINKAAEKMTGYKREVMVGKKTSIWGGQMDNSYYKKLWKTIRIEKKPFWGELTNRRKNGELYEAEINISPILDDSGKLLFFIGIERDLSKIKAVDRMKTEFISLASHQLRTPLSAVKWFGKMLISGDAGKLNQRQKEYVDKIYEANDKEIKLVNSLLNVSRIESGKILIVPNQVDLLDLVSTVMADFKLEIEKMGKRVSLILDKKIPKVYIDGDLIRHVYANLISNAARYTKKRGRIVIKVYLSRNQVMTEVKDNGIGIPKGEQKRVFDKFFRASNALKKETDGNGLGLYLSKTIVESSGGKMGFRSSEGKGSTFWFTLPIKTKTAKEK